MLQTSPIGEAYIVHHAEGRIVKRPADGSDDGIILNDTETQNQHYIANTIESSSVLNGGQIDYEAAKGVVLKNGFHASPNASFHAFMGSGGSGSPVEWLYEWDVRDHLGNLRMSYADLNGDGSIDANTEILQTQDYYPFGMKKTASASNSHDNLYGYNGIEEVNDFGLDVNMATFRTLDPALGRWWQVDPQAESLMGLSPYNSMGNSPLMYADPEGDLPWIMPHVSFDGGLRIGVTAGIGPVSGTLSYGKGGFGASIGVGVGPLSLSYGTGGFNAGLGYGINQGGLGVNFGGINYGSNGFSFSGPSVSYGHRFDLGSNNRPEYAENGLFNNLDDPVEYNQANADKYAQLGYGGTPSYTKIVADGTLAPNKVKNGETIKDGVVFNAKGERLIARGSTVPDKTSGKTNSTIFLYKDAFISKGQLLSTLGHELYHARLFKAGIHNSLRHHASIAIWLSRTHKTLGVGSRLAPLYWQGAKNHFNMGDLRYQPNLLYESIEPSRP